VAVLDEAAGLIQARLSDLETEKAKLEKALKDLGAAPAKRRGPKPGSKNKAGGKRKARRGRGKRSGPGRKEQVLAQIKGKPSIKTGEISKSLGIKSSYASNLINKLKNEGVLKGASGKWVVSEG
jgi:ribosomal protein S25